VKARSILRRGLSRPSVLLGVVALSLAGIVAAPSSLPSGARPAAAAVIVTERPDRHSALEAARLQQTRVQVSGLTTEESVTWANPDQTLTTEISDGPERVRGADGRWRPLDTTLERTKLGVQPTRSRATVVFSDGGNGAAARVETPSGKQLGFSLGARKSLPAPQLDGSVARYRNVLPGLAADLELEALPDGYAQRFVLSRRPTQPLVLRLPLHLEGVTASIGAGGELRFTDSRGQVVAEADAPLMWGAAWDTRLDEPTRRSLVGARIVDGGRTLELRPDPAFLADPSVTLPITIDPSPSLSAVADSYVDSQMPTTSFANSTTIWVGQHDASFKARGLIKFDLDALSGAQVQSATLKLWNNHTFDCQELATTQVLALTSAWSSSTNWNTQPPTSPTVYASKGFAHGNEADGCPNAFADLNLTTLTQEWVSGTRANHGLMLKAAFEHLANSFKKFASNAQPIGPGQQHNMLVVTYEISPSIEQFARFTAMQINPVGGANAGTLEYAQVNNVGQLVHGHQTSLDDFSLVQWTVISDGNAFSGQPALAQQPDGRLQAVGRNIDSGAWTKTQTTADPPAWPTTWANEGGVMASPPAVARQADGKLVVFAVDISGRLWALPQATVNGAYGTWVSLGDADLAGTPTVVVVSNGIRIFALDSAGGLKTALYAGGTLSGWTSLGGTGLNGSPAVVLYPGFIARVFVRAGDGSIVTKKQDFSGAWPEAWDVVGTFTATGSPSAVLSAVTGKAEVVARGADGVVFATGETAQGSGAWRDWVLFGPDQVPLVAATDPTTFTVTGSATGVSWAGVFLQDDGTRRVVTARETSGLNREGRSRGPVFTMHALPAPPE
jgi:hypothetical protein